MIGSSQLYYAQFNIVTIGFIFTRKRQKNIVEMSINVKKLLK